MQTEEKSLEYSGLRRLGIYSESGNENMILTRYIDTEGREIIVLNDVDLPLTEFHNYLNCLTERKDERMFELLYVSVNASFITGIIMTFVAIAVAIVKIDSWT
jgi:hypothetical protein